MIKLHKLKKEILLLKPNKVKIIYNSKDTYYDTNSKNIYMQYTNILLDTYNNIYYPIYVLLHEICHAIDTKLKNIVDQNVRFFIKNNRFCCNKPTQLHLVEYRAEKNLRKLCRENNWKDILNVSNYLIKKIIKLDKYLNIDYYKYKKFLIALELEMYGHLYAAKRIYREEF